MNCSGTGEETKHFLVVELDDLDKSVRENR